MAAGRLLLLPSSFVLLFYANLLSAFLGEQNAVSEGELKRRIDAPEVKSYLQVDGFASPHPAGDSIDRRIPSPVLSSYPLNFEPPSLDFQAQNVGMPRLQRVRITNPSQTQTLQLTSISGDSPDFHPSFFKSKVVKGGDWTTFDVVFLARVVGAVQNTLYIHTSLGTFDYKVQGIGTPNPFRLRSLLGARIPLNATYSPLITMYNPFSTSLQITEMYSSGGELHIELLTGQSQGSKTLWEIRPFETKPIARANFFGRTAINHTSFIRVKTSHTASPSLVLPVEVEVAGSPGLFLSRELLDFGMLKTGESKLLPLYVLNSEAHQVHIRSISIQPENPAVEIEYTTTVMKPGSKYSKIALVTFHSDRVTSSKQQSGRLVVRAEGRQSYQLEMPYVSHVLRGSLSYEKSQTLFRVGRPPFNPVIRNISLSNQFDIPVVLYDVRLSSRAQEYFSVVAFRGPYIIPASSEWHQPFSISFLATSSDCLFNTTLRLSTNASFFNIPLHCYDGRVKFVLENPEEDVLDYGILEEADVVTKTFTLHNPNPIRVAILSYYVSDNLPHTTVELIAIQPANMTKDKAQAKKMPIRPPFTVDPGYVGIFRVNITHPKRLGTFSGEIIITTSFEKVWHIPVYYKTAVGSLKVIPERIVFQPTFPFGTSRLPLMLKSLYPQPITITTVDPVPADSRFYAVNERIHRFPVLKPNALTELATLVFDPLLGTRENVYLGVGRGSSWSPTSSGGKQRDPGVDMREFAALWSVWSSLVDQKLTSLNFNVSVRTELGTDVKIPAEASLSWPHLFSTQLLEFSTTTVGNSTIQTLQLSNPTSWPLTIQPVLLHHYSRPHTVVNLLADRMDPELHSIDFSQSSSSFAFHVDSHTTDSAISSTVIPPHSEPYPITVAFTPKMDLQSASLLLIRNNLTVLDYVLLEGRGSQGLFTVNNVPPASEPLLFEFGTPLLEKCQTGSLFEPLVLTKSFQMHNAGSTPLNLLSVEVGGGGCEEHGFAIAHCDKQISIPPNKTKTIEISFTPDFTLSRISNTLRIQTSDGTEMLFPLLAVLPHYMLAACYAVQPRPEWEKRMAWFSVPFWLFALLALLIAVLVKTNFYILPAKLTYDSDTKLPKLQATGSPIYDLSYLTRSVHATLSQKISALRASVHPETLRRSRRPSADSTDYVAGAHTHKPLRKVHTAPLKATTAFTQEMKSGPISQPEQQIASDLKNRSLFSRHSHSVPAPTMETVISNATINTSVSPVRYELSPVTTDSRTGMREVSTPRHLTLDHGDVISADKSSPASVDASNDYSDTSTPPGLIPGDTLTMTSVTPPSSRKIRGTRKISGRSQRSETSIPPLPTQTVLVQMETKSDQLERKESESSIKSTDSESTTSSSSDKSEDKEDNGTSPGDTPAEYEIKLKPPPPLTKEPNTGQSVPITDAPEDISVMKNEAVPELPVVYRKKESLPAASSKVKGKKKLKQQMKREEKLRRRERERERERGKEQLREEQKLFEKDHDSFEYVDKESSTSNSTENFEDECGEQISEMQGSIRTEEPETLPPETKSDTNTNRGRMPQSFKTAEYITNPVDQLMLEESPERELETSASPELFVLAYQDEQILPRSDSEGSESSPPPPSVPVVQPRMGAVPSTAIKARGRSSKPQVEEVLLDPFSRNPDRSTYASKKTSTKKQPEKSRAAVEATSVKSHPKMESPVAMDAASEFETAFSKQQSCFPHASEATSPDVAEDITIGEAGRVETDGPSHLGVTKPSSQVVPTSPHELAASLLSNMQKKLKSDKDRSGVTDDTEESKAKQEDLKSAGIIVSSSTTGSSANSFVVGRTRPTRQHSGDRSSQKSVPHFSRFRPPTTLSLDAEPFYPSADFQQKLHRVHFDQRSRQKYGNTLGDYIPPSLNVPPGFSPEEAGVAFQGHYPPEKKLSKWGMDHPQHLSKGTTPSPPYTTALGDGQHFNYMDQPGLDPQESFGYSNDPLFYDAVEDPRALYAAGGGGSGMPGVGLMGRRVGGGTGGMDSRETVPPPSRLHAMEQTDLLLAAAAKRQQQQQQALAAQRRAARERSAAAYSVSGQGSLWDNPSSYRLQALQEEEGLTLQQQQLLRLYYHRQARKSAETLSALNQPPLYHRPGRSAVFPPDVNQPSSANLWDTDLLDLSPPQQSLDDSFLSEAVHAQQLRQQHLLQEQAARTMRHAPTRRRTYSGESDLGGEIVSNFQSVHQTPTSPNPPSLNRAPGTFSGFEQPRRARSSQAPSLESSGWPAEPTEPTSTSGWGGIWSLDSPFSGGDKDLRGNTHPSSQSSQQSSSQPFMGGTYDLFENQSIWSLSSGDSSGLLSWAQDKNK